MISAEEAASLDYCQRMRELRRERRLERLRSPGDSVVARGLRFSVRHEDPDGAAALEDEQRWEVETALAQARLGPESVLLGDVLFLGSDACHAYRALADVEGTYRSPEEADVRDDILRQLFSDLDPLVDEIPAEAERDPGVGEALDLYKRIERFRSAFEEITAHPLTVAEFPLPPRPPTTPDADFCERWARARAALTPIAFEQLAEKRKGLRHDLDPDPVHDLRACIVSELAAMGASYKTIGQALGDRDKALILRLKREGDTHRAEATVPLLAAIGPRE